MDAEAAYQLRCDVVLMLSVTESLAAGSLDRTATVQTRGATGASRGKGWYGDRDSHIDGNSSMWVSDETLDHTLPTAS
ncbi:hypothetical protein SCP_0302310 [Sparassis crispa]|uniref:Uncharacterized protein n=1 Tax=Sparassis crispa TaxID=139825 RepID=A0A401GEB3_9APHY|nr:hypothetical protein SCP_0302310 [Sparassis crispa]GBE80516.1 hypothetical protein SCP_0302310 [Sparassis crispa]